MTNVPQASPKAKLASVRLLGFSTERGIGLRNSMSKLAEEDKQPQAQPDQIDRARAAELGVEDKVKP